MERPIIFSGPMVRAILDGRKTQTRRPVKVLCHSTDGKTYKRPWPTAFPETRLDRCPYGKPGDRLWVREGWRIGAWSENGEFALDYRADGFSRREWVTPSGDGDGNLGERLWLQSQKDATDAGVEPDKNGAVHWPVGRGPCRWRQSIHMPRWASRLTLEVVSVRVERVQDITEDDARAEGMPIDSTELMDSGGWYDGPQPLGWFWTAWDDIYESKGYGWDANPWVWVVEFRVVEARKGALFAEALNVAHQTGLSPRQLAEQVEKLRELLRYAIHAIDEGIPQPPSHSGPCGPEAGCSGECMDYAYFCKWLEDAKATARKGAE